MSTHLERFKGALVLVRGPATFPVLVRQDLVGSREQGRQRSLATALVGHQTNQQTCVCEG